MKAICAAFLLLVTAAPLHAAGLGTPQLSDPLATLKSSEPATTARFFDPDRFLTTGGVKYFAAQDLTLEPELGIGYRARDWEIPGGIEQSTHRLHAQMGGRLSLAGTLYLSAAFKLPMVTINSAGRYAGEDLGTRPELGARYGYDFANPYRNPLTWTGELGIRLSPQTDVTLYYDQSPVSGWYVGGLLQEERFGTRFILRFK